MQNKEEFYIFINKQKLKAGEQNASNIYGSLTKLVKSERIVIEKTDNRFTDKKSVKTLAKYQDMIDMLGDKKYLNTDDYYIKKTKLQRSKMQNL
jgi:hypothetical protein